jgi:hypothetical protein
MQAVIRRKLSMARRALDFAIAHPLTDPGFVTVVKRLQDEVTRGDTLGMQEGDGRTGERSAVARRADLKRTIRRQQLRRLIRIAQRAAKDHPQLAGQFAMPIFNLPNKPFLLAARSLLTAATAQKDLFASLGLGDTFLADLTASIDQFDAATESAHTGRMDHVGASAVLVEIARGCISDVDVLDTYFSAAFPNDLELQAAWESAKNVRGPFLHREAAAPAPAPVPVPEPAPVSTAIPLGKDGAREVA